MFPLPNRELHSLQNAQPLDLQAVLHMNSKHSSESYPCWVVSSQYDATLLHSLHRIFDSPIIRPTLRMNAFGSDMLLFVCLLLLFVVVYSATPKYFHFVTQ